MSNPTVDERIDRLELLVERNAQAISSLQAITESNARATALNAAAVDALIKRHDSHEQAVTTLGKQFTAYRDETRELLHSIMGEYLAHKKGPAADEQQ